MKKNFLSLLVAFVVMAFVACEKDEESKELTKVEATGALKASGTLLEDEMRAIEEHEAVVALEVLEDMGLPFDVDPISDGAIEEMMKKSISKKNGLLQKKSNALIKKKDEFEDLNYLDYDEASGTYTYNATTKDWDVVVGVPANEIIILYPTVEGSPNNAVLTLSEYEYVDIEDEYNFGESSKGLSKLKMVLVEDGATKLTLTYNEVFESATTLSSVVMDFPPYRSTISLTSTAKAEKMSIQLLKNSLSLYNFVTETSIGVGGFDVPTNIKLQFQFGQIDLKIDVARLKMISVDDDPTVAQMNSAVVFTLNTYPDGKKIGNVSFDNNRDLVVVYSDGTKDPLSKYLKEGLMFIEDVDSEMDFDFEDPFKK